MKRECRTCARVGAEKARAEAAEADGKKLIEKLQAVIGERDAALASVKEWEEKARNWMASPEAQQQLDGYRELASKLSAAEARVKQLEAQWAAELEYANRWCAKTCSAEVLADRLGEALRFYADPKNYHKPDDGEPHGPSLLRERNPGSLARIALAEWRAARGEKKG